jgi:hypothetical protein
MRKAWGALAAASLLAGCVGGDPIALPDDHPASIGAPAGFAGSPTALDEYRTGDDFAKRAAEDAAAPPTAHANHGAPAAPAPSTGRAPQTPAPGGTDEHQQH